MPGFLFHVGNPALCPHGGQVTTVPKTPKPQVLVAGQAVATLEDEFPIAGCVFAPGGAAHPCVKVRWLVPATRVLVRGKPVILQTSAGLCQAADQVPQGAPIVMPGQPRVRGI